MNRQVFILLLVVLISAVSAAPYYPFARPYAGVNSYYYSGIAPYSSPYSSPYGSPYVSPYSALGSYYPYAATNALSYPYSYPYLGGYSGYPYVKK